MPSTIVGNGETAVSKIYRSSYPHGAYILVDEDRQWIKQVSAVEARGPRKKSKAEMWNWEFEMINLHLVMSLRWTCDIQMEMPR